MSRSWLLARPLLTPHVDNHADRYDRGHEQGDGRDQECQDGQAGRLVPQQDGRNDARGGDAHADADPDICGRRGPGRSIHQADGEVRGKRGQLSTGPRGRRLAHPFVVFVPGEPTLHQRGPERAGHLVCVCCHLVSGLGHRRYLPGATQRLPRREATITEMPRIQKTA